MKIIYRTLMISFISQCLTVTAWADIVVIVNLNNNNPLTISQIRKIYLGKTKSFPNGKLAMPLDLPSENSIRQEFLRKVVQKDKSAYNSYWARMLFSSRGRPPKTLEDSEAIKAAIRKNKNTIGFIDREDLDDSVRVVAEVP